jgi:hypothetical protein
LQYLRQKIEIWETIKRKWTKAMFLHKKQQEGLDSQVKALTKKRRRRRRRRRRNFYKKNGIDKFEECISVAI